MCVWFFVLFLFLLVFLFVSFSSYLFWGYKGMYFFSVFICWFKFHICLLLYVIQMQICVWCLFVCFSVGFWLLISVIPMQICVWCLFVSFFVGFWLLVSVIQWQICVWTYIPCSSETLWELARHFLDLSLSLTFLMFCTILPTSPSQVMIILKQGKPILCFGFCYIFLRRRFKKEENQLFWVGACRTVRCSILHPSQRSNQPNLNTCSTTVLHSSQTWIVFLVLHYIFGENVDGTSSFLCFTGGEWVSAPN